MVLWDLALCLYVACVLPAMLGGGPALGALAVQTSATFTDSGVCTHIPTLQDWCAATSDGPLDDDDDWAPAGISSVSSFSDWLHAIRATALCNWGVNLTDPTSHAVAASGTFMAAWPSLPVFQDMLEEFENATGLRYNLTVGHREAGIPNVTAENPGPYDFWMVSPDSLSTSKAQQVVADTTWLNGNDDNLMFWDIPVNWRDEMLSASSNTFNVIPGIVRSSHMFYRDDIFAAHNISVPHSWDDLIWTAATYGGHDLDGDGNTEIGICFDSSKPCVYYGFAVQHILSSIVQLKGPADGVAFDPDDLTLLVSGPALAETVRVFNALRLNSIPDDAPCMMADMSLHSSGRCLMTLGGGQVFKVSSLADSKLRGKLRAAAMPGSTRVLDRSTGKLVNCTAAMCPLGESVVNPRTGEQVIVNKVFWFRSFGFAINRFAPLYRQAAAYKMLTVLVGRWYKRVLLTVTETGPTEAGPLRFSELDVGDWVAAGYERDNAVSYLAEVRRTFGRTRNVFQEMRFPGAAVFGSLINTMTYDVVWGGVPLPTAELNFTTHVQALIDSLGGTDVFQSLYRASLGKKQIATVKPDKTSSSKGLKNPRVVNNLLLGGLLPGVSLLVIVMLGVWSRMHGAAVARLLRASQDPPGPGPLVICVTDIQDSTLLWETLSPDVCQKALQLHHSVIRTYASFFHGYESATEGDSFILVFRSAADCTRFALRTQEALLDADWPAELMASDYASSVTVRFDPSALRPWMREACGPTIRSLLRHVRKCSAPAIGPLQLLPLADVMDAGYLPLPLLPVPSSPAPPTPSPPVQNEQLSGAVPGPQRRWSSGFGRRRNSSTGTMPAMDLRARDRGSSTPATRREAEMTAAEGKARRLASYQSLIRPVLLRGVSYGHERDSRLRSPGPALGTGSAAPSPAGALALSMGQEGSEQGAQGGRDGGAGSAADLASALQRSTPGQEPRAGTGLRRSAAASGGGALQLRDGKECRGPCVPTGEGGAGAMDGRQPRTHASHLGFFALLPGRMSEDIQRPTSELQRRRNTSGTGARRTPWFLPRSVSASTSTGASASRAAPPPAPSNQTAASAARLSGVGAMPPMPPTQRDHPPASGSELLLSRDTQSPCLQGFRTEGRRADRRAAEGVEAGDGGAAEATGGSAATSVYEKASDDEYIVVAETALSQMSPAPISPQPASLPTPFSDSAATAVVFSTPLSPSLAPHERREADDHAQRGSTRRLQQPLQPEGSAALQSQEAPISQQQEPQQQASLAHNSSSTLGGASSFWTDTERHGGGLGTADGFCHSEGEAHVPQSVGFKELVGSVFPAVEMRRTEEGAAQDTRPIFRGLRVRIGFHFGSVCGSHIQFNHASQRTVFSGPVVQIAKAVTDAGRGGQITVSAAALSALDFVLLHQEASVVLHSGRHVLKDGGEQELELYSLFRQSLVARMAFLALPRSVHTKSTGVLAAPLGCLAVAVVQLEDVASWGLEAATGCHVAIRARAQELANRFRGYLLSTGPGALQSVFAEPGDAVRWLLTLQDDLTNGRVTLSATVSADAQEAVLQVPATCPMIPMLRGGVDLGTVQAGLTFDGRMTYEGPPCKRASCLAAHAPWQEVLVSIAVAKAALDENDRQVATLDSAALQLTSIGWPAFDKGLLTSSSRPLASGQLSPRDAAAKLVSNRRRLKLSAVYGRAAAAATAPGVATGIGATEPPSNRARISSTEQGAQIFSTMQIIDACDGNIAARSLPNSRATSSGLGTADTGDTGSCRFAKIHRVATPPVQPPPQPDAALLLSYSSRSVTERSDSRPQLILEPGTRSDRDVTMQSRRLKEALRVRNRVAIEDDMLRSVGVRTSSSRCSSVAQQPRDVAGGISGALPGGSSVQRTAPGGGGGGGGAAAAAGGGAGGVGGSRQASSTYTRIRSLLLGSRMTNNGSASIRSGGRTGICGTMLLPGLPYVAANGSPLPSETAAAAAASISGRASASTLPSGSTMASGALSTAGEVLVSAPPTQFPGPDDSSASHRRSPMQDLLAFGVITGVDARNPACLSSVGEAAQGPPFNDTLSSEAAPPPHSPRARAALRSPVMPCPASTAVPSGSDRPGSRSILGPGLSCGAGGRASTVADADDGLSSAGLVPRLCSASAGDRAVQRMGSFHNVQSVSVPVALAHTRRLGQSGCGFTFTLQGPGTQHAQGALADETAAAAGPNAQLQQQQQQQQDSVPGGMLPSTGAPMSRFGRMCTLTRERPQLEGGLAPAVTGSAPTQAEQGGCGGRHSGVNGVVSKTIDVRSVVSYNGGGSTGPQGPVDARLMQRGSHLLSTFAVEGSVSSPAVSTSPGAVAAAGRGSTQLESSLAVAGAAGTGTGGGCLGTTTRLVETMFSDMPDLDGKANLQTVSAPVPTEATSGEAPPARPMTPPAGNEYQSDHWATLPEPPQRLARGVSTTEVSGPQAAAGAAPAEVVESLDCVPLRFTHVRLVRFKGSRIVACRVRLDVVMR